MTLPELRRRIARAERGAGQASRRHGRFQVEWHKKFAIAAACLVFGLLGLGPLARQPQGGALGRLRPLDRRDLRLLRASSAWASRPATRGSCLPSWPCGARTSCWAASRWCCSSLNQREAAPSIRSTRAHYRAWLPQLPARAERRSRRPGRPRPVARGPPTAGAWSRAAVVLRIPRLAVASQHPRPLRGPAATSASSPWWSRPSRRSSSLVRVHGPVRRHPAEPGEGQGGVPLLRLLRALDRPPPDCRWRCWWRRSPPSASSAAATRSRP